MPLKRIIKQVYGRTAGQTGNCPVTDTDFIINASRDIICAFCHDGTIGYVNQRVREYGYQPEELTGKKAWTFAHPSDRDFVKKALTNALKTGRTMPVLPYRVRKKDGSFFHAEQKSSIIGSGGKRLIIGIIRDVSEQKKLERRLRENEELLSRIFDSAPDAIFVKDLNGSYIKANKACAALMKETTDSIIGKTDEDFFSGSLAEAVYSADRRAVKNRKTTEFTEEREYPAGRRQMHIIQTPLKDHNGSITGLLGIARDVTRLKKMESELALSRARHLLSLETRPIAHDFNNALTLINSYATLIDMVIEENSPIRPDLAKIIKGVKNAARISARLQKYARNPRLQQPKGSGKSAGSRLH